MAQINKAAKRDVERNELKQRIKELKAKLDTHILIKSNMRKCIKELEKHEDDVRIRGEWLSKAEKGYENRIEELTTDYLEMKRFRKECAIDALAQKTRADRLEEELAAAQRQIRWVKAYIGNINEPQTP